MTEESRPIFSIIIVNYNSGELLKNCVDSIFKWIKTDFEIIIFDNASGDDSMARVMKIYDVEPRLKVVTSRRNLGFAVANNEAVKTARGNFLHFLNPDTLLNERMDHDYRQAGGDAHSVYVTSLVDENGKELRNRHIIPMPGNYIRRIFRPGTTAYWNVGASVILHRTVFETLGGWPEDYFMYAEDMDLFYRIHLQKIPVVYLETGITHIGKGTTKEIWDEKERALKVEASFLRFFLKYGNRADYILIRYILSFYILFTNPRKYFFWWSVFLGTVFKKKDNLSPFPPPGNEPE
jgi:N-acetylglucosaminyl-diphospho-decaprenol L-rhamnosyltransferase